LYFEWAKTGRVDIEPFFSAYGYGVSVKVIFQFTWGTGEDKFVYDRVLHEDAMVRKLVTSAGSDETWEMFSEYFESFYHNKIGQDVIVPITALLLNTYFPEIVERYNLDLTEYVTEVTFEDDKRIGYK